MQRTFVSPHRTTRTGVTVVDFLMVITIMAILCGMYVIASQNDSRGRNSIVFPGMMPGDAHCIMPGDADDLMARAELLKDDKSVWKPGRRSARSARV